MPDGTFYSGRPFTTIGAHCIEADRGTLGFLLIESRKIDRIGEFDDWFTDPQRHALVQKLLSIPGLERVSGRNDYSEKLCPGFRVKALDWV